MFSNCNYSLADIAAATGNSGNRSNDGMFGEGFGWWIILIFLFAFGGWGNGFGGWGGNGGGANSPGLQGLATRADINEGFAFNNLTTGIDAAQSQLCNGFNSVNNTMLQGFNALQAQNAQCCCDTKAGLADLKYTIASESCDTRHAITDGFAALANINNQNTQRIVDMFTSNQIQSLRDQLQAASYQISQNEQTAAIISQINPCPKPCYLTCSPYQAMTMYSNFGNGCCGCNCC